MLGGSMKINFSLMQECAVDGCYKKKINKRMFCKEHEKDFQDGKQLKCFYGKIIKKPCGEVV
jgi:hypothetical protein